MVATTRQSEILRERYLGRSLNTPIILNSRNIEDLGSLGYVPDIEGYEAGHKVTSKVIEEVPQK